MSRFLSSLLTFFQVFHELARHLQTRRLVAGDSLSLDQDTSFYCVVDGTVQLYAPTGFPRQEGRNGAWDGEDLNGYQLLNEVGTGGTLSSLFTILSLFTENVKISWQDEQLSDDEVASGSTTHRSTRTHLHRSDSDVPHFTLDPTSSSQRARRSSVSSSGSTIHAADLLSPNTTPSVRGGSQAGTPSHHGQAPRRSHPAEAHLPSHYGVVARATEDSTLAVIPAEAFRRLTKKFPKATAHIIQGMCSPCPYIMNFAVNWYYAVILTRFSRVTFNAAHQYLGLTSEVLRTEKAINDIACHPLPPSFYEGGGLRQLRLRFDGVSSPDPSDTSSGYFSVSSSKVSSKASLATTGSEERKAPQLTDSPASISRSPAVVIQATSSRQLVHAGDLLSSTSHPSEVFRPNHQSRNSLFTPSLSWRRLPSEDESGSPPVISDDDFDLRDAVMSCIAKSIGLLQPPLSGDESVEASPLFSPSESSRSRSGVFKSPFGSLSLLEIGDDGTSSMTGSTSSTTTDGYMSGLDNEVEILFYPAGSTLAKAGESNTGRTLILLAYAQR